MENIILPKVPSELIRIALEDMKATIKQGFQINMNVWGDGILDEKNHCSVCFAGSVMLQRTKVGNDPRSFVNGFSDMGENAKQYYFLDYIRKGILQRAMDLLGIEPTNAIAGPLTITGWAETIPDWVYYSKKNEKEFLTQVEQLADMLESIGL